MKVNVRANIMAFLWTVLLFFTINGTVYSQFSMGAASVSMGHTGTAMPASPWSAFSNPAWMSTDQSSVSFFGYRFSGFSELTDMAVSLTQPSAFGTFGLGAHRYGYEHFTEQRFIFAMKQHLDRVHAGLSLSYQHISFGESYGSAAAVGISFGLGIQVTETLSLGARAMHLNRPAYANSEELIPGELATGVGYKISNIAFLTADIVKDPDFPVSFRSGLSIEIVESLFIRSGITGKPSSYSFGFGYQPGDWQVNLGVQQHHALGLSAAMDFVYHFNF